MINLLSSQLVPRLRLSFNCYTLSLPYRPLTRMAWCMPLISPRPTKVRVIIILNKYSMLYMPDNIYNWIVNFFRDCLHCTRFGDEVSKFCAYFGKHYTRFRFGSSFLRCNNIWNIDVHPVTPGNSVLKFAHDTYLIVPAANVQSCVAEIAQVENWAAENNLSLNLTKFIAIVFM